MEQDQPREFALFLVTGGIAALVNIATRIAFDAFMPFEVAVILAYFCGMAVAYLLARMFVFARSGRGMHSEFARFAIVNVLGIAQVWVISVGLARWLFPALGFTWHADTVAHVLGVAAPVVTSYFGHRHFSFARPNDR